MRLIMMGTGPFAEPAFRLMLETRHEMAALATSPLRPRHDKCKSAPPASGMRDIAHQHGIEIFDPQDINDRPSRERLASYGADLLIVCDYGRILSAETLSAARLGGINLHGSLLPKYRGAAPVNWAIYHGETQTGVTVIHMTPCVDAGPCIAQASTPIDPEETAVELEARLSEVGGWLIRRTVDALEKGALEPLPQDDSLACKAPRLKKSDGLVDWSRSSLEIKNHIRAMEPWPKCYTFWRRGGEECGKKCPLRLIVGPVEILDTHSCGEAEAGEVVEADAARLAVKTGDGAVLLGQLQPAGKKAMDIEEFLRGYRVAVGDRFAAQ